MHNHSEKIEPRKLAITIILAILLIAFAYMTRVNRDITKSEQETAQKATSTISQ